MMDVYAPTKTLIVKKERHSGSFASVLSFFRVVEADVADREDDPEGVEEVDEVPFKAYGMWLIHTHSRKL